MPCLALLLAVLCLACATCPRSPAPEWPYQTELRHLCDQRGVCL